MTIVFFILVEITTPLMIIINKYSEKDLPNTTSIESELGGFALSVDLLEDSSSNADISGEGALMVDVVTLNGGLRGLEACTVQTPQLERPNAIIKWRSTYQVRSFCRI